MNSSFRSCAEKMVRTNLTLQHGTVFSDESLVCVYKTVQRCNANVIITRGLLRNFRVSNFFLRFVFVLTKSLAPICRNFFFESNLLLWPQQYSHKDYEMSMSLCNAEVSFAKRNVWTLTKKVNFFKGHFRQYLMGCDLQTVEVPKSLIWFSVYNWEYFNVGMKNYNAVGLPVSNLQNSIL